MATPAGASAMVAAFDCRRWLWSVLGTALGLLTVGVSALEVYTPEEIFVTSGTQGKLTCTFKSSHMTGLQTSVSWSFQPEGSDITVSFFHYLQGEVYPGNWPVFKDRVSWAGDISKKDASINIENMQSIHNGTYTCDVKNALEVAQSGHVRLYVVEKENLPVAVVVGIVSAVVLGLILFISLILAVCYRRKTAKRDYTGCSTSESLAPAKQAPQKSPFDTQGLVKSLPSRSHQGPVIYAQLDHSGGHHSNKINKSESVVYADIRKN